MNDRETSTTGEGLTHDSPYIGDDASDAPEWGMGFDDDSMNTAMTPSIEVFPHDQGTLTWEQRRTYIGLLKQRYITPRSHPTEWHTLVEHVELFRSRLHDLMLDLRFDSERGVAYKTQILFEDTLTPRLLMDRGHTREDTIILVFLRQRLYKDLGDGIDVVVVDEDEILDHVAAYRPNTATDQVRDRNITEKALQRIIDAGIVKRTTDTARLAIQPVLETLMPLETMRELARTLSATIEDSDPNSQLPGHHTTQNEGTISDD